MKIQTKTIEIDHTDGVFDLVTSNTSKEIIYLLNKKFELLKIDINTGETVFKKQIEKGKINTDTNIKIELSPLDEYLCITNTSGQFGLVYDIEKALNILALDRKDYHTEQTVFPIAFLLKSGRTLLIHATDWNHLEVTDLKEQNLLTKRQNEYKSEFYLDYFYGELHLSPSKNKLLSSGWVWQPAAVFKSIDLQNWLDKNLNEPEMYKQGNHVVMSYYWDRAVCWMDETNIGFIYDPKEEDLDPEDYKELKISKDKNYLAIYDTTESNEIQYIEIDPYSKNEHSEATGDCKLFFQENFIFSSKTNGVTIYRGPTFGGPTFGSEAGAPLYKNDTLYFSKHNEALGLFYHLTNDHSLVLGEIIS